MQSHFLLLLLCVQSAWLAFSEFELVDSEDTFSLFKFEGNSCDNAAVTFFEPTCTDDFVIRDSTEPVTVVQEEPAPIKESDKNANSNFSSIRTRSYERRMRQSASNIAVESNVAVEESENEEGTEEGEGESSECEWSSASASSYSSNRNLRRHRRKSRTTRRSVLKKKKQPSTKRRAYRKKTQSLKVSAAAAEKWPHRSPQLQRQAAVHAELLQKYNNWRISQGLEERSNIYRIATDFIGWPDTVQCTASRTWSHDDMDAIEASLPQISFKLIENPPKEPPGKQRAALNNSLHRQLLEKAKQAGFKRVKQNGFDWSKIRVQLPSFKISDRDFAKWCADDRKKIKEILIDTFLEAKIKELEG